MNKQKGGVRMAIKKGTAPIVVQLPFELVLIETP